MRDQYLSSLRSFRPYRLIKDFAVLTCLILLASCTTSEASTNLSVDRSTPTSTATLMEEFSSYPLPLDTPLITPTNNVESSPEPESQELNLATAEHTATPAPPTQRPTLDIENWTTLPVIPSVSDNARAIYQRGLELGRDPRAYSKVGDCQVSTDFFLVSFDIPDAYNLGEYAHFQRTIDWYSGSFARSSMASRDAMRAESLFSPLYADPTNCQPGEGPLACEYRLHNPSIAIFSMEQTWAPNIDVEKYKKYMRQAIEYTISMGIVPILSTKADNLEGDHQINKINAQLAWEYDIPLWNFWAAVQPLRYHGLQSETPSGKPDMYHLTAGRYYNFNVAMEKHSGWSMRNLTALQSLDAVWQGLSQP